MDCGFRLSDAIPSEASYSRMLSKIVESPVLERVQETLILQAMTEGFITDDTVAIDATHIDARDKAPSKEEKFKPEPKKRERKSKEEKEEWLQEQAEREAALPIFEKKIEAQLDASLVELRSAVPLDPKWGIKKNSEGKNVFCLATKDTSPSERKVSASFIRSFSSGNLNDGNAKIPLLKGIQECLSELEISYSTLDAGYDYLAIYQQISNRSAICYCLQQEK